MKYPANLASFGLVDFRIDFESQSGTESDPDDFPEADVGDPRLTGLTIGYRVRWPSFRVFCDELDDTLRSRYHTSGESLWWDLDTEAGNPRVGSSPTSDFKPRARELLSTILDSDVAIFGLAACGSCSEEAVTDFSAACHAGQPSILVCTDRFVDLCRIRAAALGVPNVRPLVLPHPFETLDREVIRQIARERTAEFAGAIARLAPSGVLEQSGGRV